MNLGKKMMRIISCVADTGRFRIGKGDEPLKIHLTQYDENGPATLEDIVESPATQFDLRVNVTGSAVTHAILVYMFLHRHPEVMKCVQAMIAVGVDDQAASKVPENTRHYKCDGAFSHGIV